MAMLFMQFKSDMAICLIKGHLFPPMLSVFVVMPGLLMLFGPYMSKTKHRNFVPKDSFVGRYAYKTRKDRSHRLCSGAGVCSTISDTVPLRLWLRPDQDAVLNETRSPISYR